MLRAMVAFDASQTIPVQIVHVVVFVLFYTNWVCAILIPVRVLLVTWCVLIKVNNRG